MRWVDPAEGGEKLPGFELKIERQACGLGEGLLDFDLGLIVVIQLEDDVGESLKVGVNRTVERELDVSRVETSLLRIVIADFDVIEITCRRTGQREHRIERDVHVILAAANR